jgi:ATP-dependent DNA ligase
VGVLADSTYAEPIKSARKVQLCSRNNKAFNGKYPSIVKALAAMPDETVIDGEIERFANQGRFAGLTVCGN